MMQNNWDRNENSYQQDSMDNAAHHVRGMGDMRDIMVTLPSRSWNIKTFIKSIIVLLATIGMVLLTSALPSQRANAVSPSSVPTLGPDAFNSPVNPGEQFKWHSLGYVDDKGEIHGLTAHWSHSLRVNSLYWSSPDSVEKKTGSAANILGENYGFYKDSAGHMEYKTRPVLYLNPSTDIFQNNWSRYSGKKWDLGKFNSRIQQGIYGPEFSKAAVGHIKGTTAGSLSVLFWDWNMDPWDAIIQDKFNLCPVSTTKQQYALMWRIDSAERGTNVPVQATCFPMKVIYNGTAGATEPNEENISDWTVTQLSGGQIDPRTGYLYVAAQRVSYLDQPVLKGKLDNTYNNNQSGNGTSANFQIIVWDPATGKWLSSGPIQPLTLDERRKYALTNCAWFKLGWRGEKHGWNDGTGTTPTTCSLTHHGANYRPAQGLAIDGNGNIEVIVSGYSSSDQDVPNTGNSQAAKRGNYSETLLKIDPLIKNGYIAKPTIKPYKMANSNPDIWPSPLGNNGYGWAYEVINRFQRRSSANSNSSLSGFSATVGCYRSIASYRGKFFEFGYGAPVDGFDFEPNDKKSTASVSMYFDPQQEGVSVAAADTNYSFAEDAEGDYIGDKSSTSDDYIQNEITNKQLSDKTRPGWLDIDDMDKPYIWSVASLTSVPVIRSIHGVIYLDKDGKGSMPMSGTAPDQHFAGVIDQLLPIKESEQTPRLANEEVALYDSAHKVVGITYTNDKGEYNFDDFDADSAAQTTYYVRLVQPQIDLLGEVTEKTVADPSDSSGIKHIYVSSVGDDNSHTHYTNDKNHLMRNAVQSWALNDSLIHQRYPVDKWRYNYDSHSHDVATDLDITSKAQCGVNDTSSGTNLSGGLATSNGDSQATQKTNCYGARQAPYIDPNPGSNADNALTNDDEPIHSIISFRKSNPWTDINAIADFAVTAAGSYGDANEPPFKTTNKNKGPYFTGIDPNQLHLGATIGNYTDGPKDAHGNSIADAENHSTDDGATFERDRTDSKYVQSPSDLKITVSGRPATPYYVQGWISSINTSVSNGKPIWDSSATVQKKLWAYSTGNSMAHHGWNPIGSSGHVTLTIPNIISKTVGASSSSAQALDPGNYLLRIVVAPVQLVKDKRGDNLDRDNIPHPDFLDPDDARGEYNGPTAGSEQANIQNWTYPGEVEDYLISIKSNHASIVRFQSLINKKGTLSNPINVPYTDGTKTVTNIIKKYNVFSPETSNYNLDSHTFTGDTKLSGQFTVDYGTGDSETFMTTFNNGDRGLWYDSTYKNPKGISPDVGTSGEGPWNNPYKSGVACFEKNQVASNEASDAEDNPGFPIGINVSAEEGQPVKITLARSEVGTGTIITCQVPFTYSQFTLPLAGRTIPWASVVGMTVLLLGIAGIAIVLVRRK